MEACPCGSGRPLSVCCEPLLQGERAAATPQELLRSRYTAYSLANVDYVCSTQVEFDREAVESWSSTAQFRQLRILGAQKEEPRSHPAAPQGDLEAVLDFEADFETGGKLQTHRERSTFRKIADRWLFVKGQGIPTVAAPRVGRNDACPCGSGKKFKKCCG